MSWWRRRVLGIRCRFVVRTITDYLEGALDPATAAALEAHFGECDGCSAALDQFRRTIRVTGTLPAGEVAQVPEPVRSEILAAYRVRHRA